tara:strand:- start:28 stop:456 length:429 start_codon:yes stop_codon:yes gene_type:complete
MKHYITQLRDDANDSTVHPNIEWKDSSYHNDACPSICADLDGNAEWYVQLFAFENIEEAKAEGFDEIYGITVSSSDECNYSEWAGSNRNQAIKKAIDYACDLQRQHLRRGVEHEGVWIEDRTKSPCGRFDLTPEQSEETYGK